MKLKILNRCQDICRDVMVNPKLKHRLAYVMEALEIEKNSNKFRVIGLKDRRDEKDEK